MGFRVNIYQSCTHLEKLETCVYGATYIYGAEHCSDYILESLPWGKIQGSDRYLQKSRVAIRVAVAIATLIATLVATLVS